MVVIVTFKLAPESPGAVETFAQDYVAFRQAMEAGARHQLFGDPDKVELRWLLTNGLPDDEPSEG